MGAHLKLDKHVSSIFGWRQYFHWEVCLLSPLLQK